MPNFDYRVFISYRGASEGKEFASELYEYIKQDPMSEKKYGKIYYSPRTKSVEVNFKKDIREIINTVEYFIMPLTENYYADFWDEENDCPNEDSITYHEIIAAIENKCRFICVSFPQFEVDSELLTKLFGQSADELLCVAPLEYDKTNKKQIFNEICNVIKKKNQENLGMSFLQKNLNPNVFLAFKKDTEDRERFPFYEKLHDVTKITLLNFASSAFISGIDIATTYEESDSLKAWFNHNLVNGEIEADIILTNPHSYAAHDAAMYKMYPAGLTTSKNEIILTNMNKLFSFLQKYPKAKLNIYLTDIVLPYGVMITENKNPANNHMKVDLYAPVISDDKKRPSFYMLQSNPETEMMYSFFVDNVKNIMNNYAFRYKGHPDTKWLTQKHIIHRGVSNSKHVAHTREAFDACIEHGYPIEVDLLQLKDDTIVVGRQDQILVFDGEEKRLMDCNRRDLRTYNKQAGNKRFFTLEDFLAYIGGKIPVLLEVKNDHKNGEQTYTEEQKEKYVKKIIEIVQSHLEHVSHRIAFHSADPYILKLIKDRDCLIPCGIISKDFYRVKEIVGEEFCEMHAQRKYLEIVSPDFISYDVNDLENRSIRNMCDELRIPLLGWTVVDEDMQQQAIDYGCDTIIIEGSRTYL